MYQIVNKSSGIVAYSNTNRGQCMHWLLLNGFDEDGVDLGLYELRKGSQKALEAPTRPPKQSGNTRVVSQ